MNVVSGIPSVAEQSSQTISPADLGKSVDNLTETLNAYHDYAKTHEMSGTVVETKVEPFLGGELLTFKSFLDGEKKRVDTSVPENGTYDRPYARGFRMLHPNVNSTGRLVIRKAPENAYSDCIVLEFDGDSATAFNIPYGSVEAALGNIQGERKWSAELATLGVPFGQKQEGKVVGLQEMALLERHVLTLGEGTKHTDQLGNYSKLTS